MRSATSLRLRKNIAIELPRFFAAPPTISFPTNMFLMTAVKNIAKMILINILFYLKKHTVLIADTSMPDVSTVTANWGRKKSAREQ